MKRIGVIFRASLAAVMAGAMLNGCAWEEVRAEPAKPPVYVEKKADASYCIVPRRKPRKAGNAGPEVREEKARYLLEFEKNTPVPTPETIARIEIIAGALRARSGGQITIIGHAAGAGGTEEDFALARSRARKAAELLAAEGLDLSRAEVITCGPEKSPTGESPLPPGMVEILVR